MILIDDILVSDEIINNQFVCDLKACKGACCTEGDFGAPLDRKEISELPSYIDHIKKYLSSESIEEIERQGLTTYYEEPQLTGTPVMPDGACVYLAKDPLGYDRCSFEMAHQNKEIDFKKPISCHLYPIRVEENSISGFIAVNYDVWSICKAACTLGEKLQIPLYQFVKDAIIRKFGMDFYAALDDAYENKELFK